MERWPSGYALFLRVDITMPNDRGMYMSRSAILFHRKVSAEMRTLVCSVRLDFPSDGQTTPNDFWIRQAPRVALSSWTRPLFGMRVQALLHASHESRLCQGIRSLAEDTQNTIIIFKLACWTFPHTRTDRGAVLCRV